MRSTANSADEYITSLPDDRRYNVSAIRDTINKNLPKGFKEGMAYGMISWAVPHELYPPGYHCDPELPLGFMGLASQKQYIALYSMCLYGHAGELAWFKKEWPKHTSQKLDIGKSCIRFKKTDDIPLDLIGTLATRVSPQQWIEIYEKALKRRSCFQILDRRPKRPYY